MSLFTHPLTKDINAWWGAYGSNTSSAEWQLYIKHLSELIGVKCKEISEAHSNDGRFGMSGAGGCTRRAVLKLLGCPEEAPSPDTAVTWHIGHLLESVPIATLRAMGYTVEGLQEPVKIDPIMLSYTDGIITTGPRDDIPYPVCLSVKTMGYKMSFFSKDSKKMRRNGFPSMCFEGVRNGQPSWYAQSQMEMLGTGNSHSLVVVIAKDIIQAFKDDEYMQSLSFYAELIKADKGQQGSIKDVWKDAWKYAHTEVDEKEIESVPALYYTKSRGHVEIPEPGSDGGMGKNNRFSMWAGPNQEVLPFNVCGSCNFRKLCAGENEQV